MKWKDGPQRHSDETLDLNIGEAVVGDTKNGIHLFLEGEMCGLPEYLGDVAEDSIVGDVDYETIRVLTEELEYRTDASVRAAMTPTKARELSSLLESYAELMEEVNEVES